MIARSPAQRSRTGDSTKMSARGPSPSRRTPRRSDPPLSAPGHICWVATRMLKNATSSARRAWTFSSSISSVSRARDRFDYGLDGERARLATRRLNVVDVRHTSLQSSLDEQHVPPPADPLLQRNADFVRPGAPRSANVRALRRRSARPAVERAQRSSSRRRRASRASSCASSSARPTHSSARLATSRVLARHAALTHQVIRETLAAEGPETDLLAARHQRRQHRFRIAGGQHQHHARRRLFQGLEQPSGGGWVSSSASRITNTFRSVSVGSSAASAWIASTSSTRRTGRLHRDDHDFRGGVRARSDGSADKTRMVVMPPRS